MGGAEMQAANDKLNSVLPKGRTGGCMCPDFPVRM